MLRYSTVQTAHLSCADLLWFNLVVEDGVMIVFWTTVESAYFLVVVACPELDREIHGISTV